jgi:hypothetical protein
VTPTIAIHAPTTAIVSTTFLQQKSCQNDNILAVFPGLLLSFRQQICPPYPLIRQRGGVGGNPPTDRDKVKLPDKRLCRDGVSATTFFHGGFAPQPPLLPESQRGFRVHENLIYVTFPNLDGGGPHGD